MYALHLHVKELWTPLEHSVSQYGSGSLGSLWQELYLNSVVCPA